MLLVHLSVCVSFCNVSLPLGVGGLAAVCDYDLPGLSINFFEDGHIYTDLYVKPTDKQLCLYNSFCKL